MTDENGHNEPALHHWEREREGERSGGWGLHYDWQTIARPPASRLDWQTFDILKMAVDVRTFKLYTRSPGTPLQCISRRRSEAHGHAAALSSPCCLYCLDSRRRLRRNVWKWMPRFNLAGASNSISEGSTLFDTSRNYTVKAKTSAGVAAHFSFF